MNMIANIHTRPVLSLSFDGKAKRPPSPAPAATLSKSELKTIVAAILG
jgi:hypothetical protein